MFTVMRQQQIGSSSVNTGVPNSRSVPEQNEFRSHSVAPVLESRDGDESLMRDLMVPVSGRDRSTKSRSELSMRIGLDMPEAVLSELASRRVAGEIIGGSFNEEVSIRISALRPAEFPLNEPLGNDDDSIIAETPAPHPVTAFDEG